LIACENDDRRSKRRIDFKRLVKIAATLTLTGRNKGRDTLLYANNRRGTNIVKIELNIESWK
jgi:hypothetical protein